MWWQRVNVERLAGLPTVPGRESHPAWHRRCAGQLEHRGSVGWLLLWVLLWVLRGSVCAFGSWFDLMLSLQVCLFRDRTLVLGLVRCYLPF